MKQRPRLQMLAVMVPIWRQVLCDRSSTQTAERTALTWSAHRSPPAPDRGPAGSPLPEKTLTQDCCHGVYEVWVPQGTGHRAGATINPQPEGGRGSGHCHHIGAQWVGDNRQELRGSSRTRQPAPRNHGLIYILLLRRDGEANGSGENYHWIDSRYTHRS